VILGLKKGQTNSGSFKKGERKSRKTEFKKGQKTWNKGLTKETSKIIRKYADKQKGMGKGKRRSIKTEFKKGQKPWNKGKILVPLDEQRKKINERAREKYAQSLAKIVEERSKGSQFIMVSLKDSVVEKAKLIYGVYPKNGVSHVVTYKDKRLPAIST